MRRSSPRWPLKLASVLGLAVSAGSAHAWVRVPSGWVFPVGLDVGLAYGSEAPVAATLGLEASVVYLTKELEWVGLVGRAGRDFARAGLRWAVGPEIGWGFLGFEALLAGQDTDLGLQLRLTAPLFIVTPYLGLTTVDERRYEAGLLLKFPFGLD